MCIAPKVKVPATPPPAQYQPTQPVQDTLRTDFAKRRRGFYAALFTGSRGLASKPVVTGTSGGMTGG